MWSIGTGLQVTGNPNSGPGFGPLPTPADLRDNTVVPDVFNLRILVVYTALPSQLSDWQDWIRDAIAAGYRVIPYAVIPGTRTGSDTTQTDAEWVTSFTQWATYLTAAGVKTLEIGNEPTQDKFPTFFSRFKAAAPIARQQGATAIMASGVGVPIGTFVTAANAAAGGSALPYADGLVVHPYSVAARPAQINGTTREPNAASGPGSPLAKCQDARTALDNIGGYAAELPLYITETGYGTEPNAAIGQVNNRVGTSASVGQRETWQAERLTESLDSLLSQANAKANKIRLVSWYTLRDTEPTPSNDPFEHYGLKYNTWSTPRNAGVDNKPAYAAMQSYGLGAIDLSPPVVTTGTTTGPQGATATVPGTINPGGRSTTYWVQYGRTKGYGKNSTIGGPLVGSSLQSVTRALTGLSAGIWHYRMVASSESATVYGSDQTLSVISVVPVPDGSAGSGLGVVTETYPVTGLEEDTDYQYRIVATNPHGTSIGNWVTFHTAQNIVLPTANTGAVTNVTLTAATLNATVSANGSAGTQYWFEWGTSQAYGNQTTPTPISGNVLTPVSVQLTGLTQNQVYHYRIVAQNSDGTVAGTDAHFGFTPPASEPPELFAPSLLPIDLSVEIQTADGRLFRWDPDDQDPTKRPQDMRFGTAEGDGFADASCILSRPVGLDWPDLNLLQMGRLVGAQGFIAYEGRVTATPRTVGDEGEQFEVDFSGWMSSARDRPFTEIYVDRSGDRWQEPGLSLRKGILNADFPLNSDFTATTDAGSISFKGVGNPTGADSKSVYAGSRAVLVYEAPGGTKVSSFGYIGQEKYRTTSQNNIVQAQLYGDDDGTTPEESWAETKNLTVATAPADGTLQSAGFTTARKFACLDMRNATSTTPIKAAFRHYDRIAVYGNHGATTRANGDDPNGVYASDVFKDIVGRFCPQLDASQIANTTVVLPHLVFDAPTAPFDALTLLNGYHAYLLNAWENGVIQWEPADLTEPDWIVRKGEPGVGMELHGESTDQFANGIVVSYTDVNQRQQVLFPDAFAQLRDDDPDNQANKTGIQLWTTLELSVPVDRKGALTLGATALAEFNRPKWPGTVSIASGYVSDINENPLPAYRVRCGQTLSIVNLPNDAPRLITATDYSEDGSLTVTLEAPPTRIDAVLARLEPPPGLLG